MDIVTSAILWIVSVLAAVVTIITFLEDNYHNIYVTLRGGIPKGFLIFITGTNGVGKTTIALKVSRRLGISSVVEVNDLRESLRSVKYVYDDTNRKDEYDILKHSSYLLSNSARNKTGETDFQKQCALMTTTIKTLAEYKQKNNKSAVFEGINISPKLLVSLELPAHFVLFINLHVSDKKTLLKRLDQKSVDNMEKRNNYHTNINKIMEIGRKIDDEFDNISECTGSKTQIHKITIDSTSISKRKVTKTIVREVRKIYKPVH